MVLTVKRNLRGAVVEVGRHFDYSKAFRLPFAIPCKATVIFIHADRRRRDVAGMIDALCHVLERAGVVNDDSLIVDWDIHTTPEPNKAKAGVEIRLETL